MSDYKQIVWSSPQIEIVRQQDCALILSAEFQNQEDRVLDASAVYLESKPRVMYTRLLHLTRWISHSISLVDVLLEPSSSFYLSTRVSKYRHSNFVAQVLDVLPNRRSSGLPTR